MFTALRMRLTMGVVRQIRLYSGGKSGAIREAGGNFAKKEAADEEQYFRKLRTEQLAKLKEDLHDEISFHEEQIKRHQDSIARHKAKVTDLDKK